MNKPKVYLTGGDNMNWALDNDLQRTQQALDGLVQFTGIKQCDVVHSMWWSELATIPDDLVEGKRIICQIPGEPLRYLNDPKFSSIARKVGHWIAQSKQAATQLNNLQVPYTPDPIYD